MKYLKIIAFLAAATAVFAQPTSVTKKQEYSPLLEDLANLPRTPETVLYMDADGDVVELPVTDLGDMIGLEIGTLTVPGILKVADLDTVNTATSEEHAVTPKSLWEWWGDITSSQLLMSPLSGANPTYSFYGMSGTGMGAVGGHIITFSTNGVQRFSIGQSVLRSTIPALGPDGTSSNPAWSFSSYPSSGMWVDATGLRFSYAGTIIGTFTSTNRLSLAGSLDMTSGRLQIAAGNETQNAIYAPGAGGTGMWWPDNTSIAWSINGVQRMTLTSSGGLSITGGIQTGDRFISSSGGGSAGLPAGTRAGDGDTGYYFPAAGQFAITTDGGQRALFSSDGLSLPSQKTYPDATTAMTRDRVEQNRWISAAMERELPIRDMAGGGTNPIVNATLNVQGRMSGYLGAGADATSYILVRGTEALNGIAATGASIDWSKPFVFYVQFEGSVSSGNSILRIAVGSISPTNADVTTVNGTYAGIEWTSQTSARAFYASATTGTLVSAVTTSTLNNTRGHVWIENMGNGTINIYHATGVNARMPATPTTTITGGPTSQAGAGFQMLLRGTSATASGVMTIFNARLFNP